jgi:hypothetical protein
MDFSRQSSGYHSEFPESLRMIPVDELLADHQEYHSELQMDAFITLRAGGTLYGCYKQALRELNSRKLAVIQRRTQMQLADLERRQRARSTVSEYVAERNKIKNEESNAVRSFAEQALADTERELRHFQGQGSAIRELLESRGVTFPLDAETRHRLDCEMWEHRLKCMAAIDYMHSGRLERSTIEFLQAVPPTARRRLAVMILDASRHTELVEWYMGYESEMPLLYDSSLALECSA